jgi:hypothetical protein
MKAAKIKSVRKRCAVLQKGDASNIHVELRDDNTLIVNPHAADKDDIRIYKPTPTFEKFHKDETFVRCIMGPYGTGKTTGCLVDGVINAIRMPVGRHGIRWFKMIVVRNTSPELESTTIPTWENWFGELGIVKKRLKSPITFRHRFNDAKGTICLTVLFLALNRPTDIKKLKSFECSYAVLEEASELDFQTFTHSKIRVGRYPSKQLCQKPFAKKIVLPTNPPHPQHWIHEIFEELQPLKHIIYKQPAGLLWDDEGNLIPNPEAENIDNLPGGYNYYFDAAQGATKEFIRVFIMGFYGTLKAGQLVYGDNYNDDVHSVDDIKIDKNFKIVKVKLDYGLRAPAILICQYVDGQLRAIKEFCGSCTTMGSLYETACQPWLLQNANFEGVELDIKGDPANTAGGAQEIEAFGLPVGVAATNKIATRIDAVLKLLNNWINGKPRFILSRKGCPMLRKGFLREYVLKEVNTTQGKLYRDYPDKDKHPFSDVHDCLQYEALDYYDEFVQTSSDDAGYDEYERHKINKLKNRVTGY